MATIDGQIESRDLCSSSVIERILSDESVSSIKIAKTIQSDNFSTGSSGWQINRDTGSAEFQDVVVRGTLNADDITVGTLPVGRYGVGDITGTHIAGGTITTANIAANTIEAGDIAANTITASEISANTITASEIAVGTITANEIAANTITASEIAALTITASQIAADTITASEIAANTIDTSELAANSVTATEINVTSLDAITANMGTLTVDDTLTMGAGGEIKTASDGNNRLELTSGGLKGYNSSNVLQGTLTMWSGVTLQYDSGSYVSLGPTSSSLFADNASVTVDDANDIVGITVNSTVQMEAHDGYVLFPNETRHAGGIDADFENITDVNRILVEDGSKTVPPYSFTDDSNTGMYSIADNFLGFTAQGTLTMQLGTSGDKYFYGLASDGSDPFLRWDTTTGQIQYDSSSRDIKKHIEDLTQTTTRFLRLLPTRFEMKDSKQRGKRYGFIAEDVADVYPVLAQRGLVTATGPDEPNIGKPKIVGYDLKGIQALTVLELQRLIRRVDALEAA